MLNSILFGSYCTTLATMGYFLGKIKLIDDKEREIRDLREFEFANEKLREGNSKDKKAIVMARYRKPKAAEIDAEPVEAGENPEEVLIKREIAYFNDIDPARLFTAKISESEKFNLVFTDSE
jgi:hypothetical protein